MVKKKVCRGRRKGIERRKRRKWRNITGEMHDGAKRSYLLKRSGVVKNGKGRRLKQ